jgi:hypothetical protein
MSQGSARRCRARQCLARRGQAGCGTGTNGPTFNFECVTRLVCCWSLCEEPSPARFGVAGHGKAWWGLAGVPMALEQGDRQ